ncbi:MAG: 4-hydroxy-tetrahydrodipicolinate reductase [Proteobacteria bacterium]|nr:4-hydroxy-tetrahydrodipicolinate reductase [Pseudomonadota bacterium]
MKIGIVGCGGSMGRALVQGVIAAPDMDLAGASGRPGSAIIGRDAGEVAGAGKAGIAVVADADWVFKGADAVIDFSVAGAVQNHAALAAKHGTPLVIGTSGISADQQKAVADAAQKVAIVQAANMSVGLNLVLGWTEQVARILGPEYDVEILELHHRKKVDAPSGTSLALGRAAARARGVDFAKAQVRGRDGDIGPRPAGAIGFSVIRGGDSLGEHTVIFAGTGERIEIAHRASSRAIYTSGALKAAAWLKGRKTGLYSMLDMLGLSAPK